MTIKDRLEKVIKLSNLCNCARAYLESTPLHSTAPVHTCKEHQKDISYLAKAILNELPKMLPEKKEQKNHWVRNDDTGSHNQGYVIGYNQCLQDILNKLG